MRAGTRPPFGTPAFSFSAHHEVHGILIASGPMFGNGKLEGRQNLLDITPTLMYLEGETVPGYMEGRVLTGLFLPDYLHAHPVKVDKTEAEETGSEAVERIKAVPYVQ